MGPDFAVPFEEKYENFYGDGPLIWRTVTSQKTFRRMLSDSAAGQEVQCSDTDG